MSAVKTILEGTTTLKATSPPLEPFAAWILAHPGFAAAIGLTFAFAGRFLFMIASEYVKLWLFKGIPPWRVSVGLLQKLESMEQALSAQRLEFEVHRDAVNRALDRAERIEREAIRLRIDNGRLRERVRHWESFSHGQMPTPPPTP